MWLNQAAAALIELLWEVQGHHLDSADQGYFFNHFHPVGGNDSLLPAAAPVPAHGGDLQAAAEVDALPKRVGCPRVPLPSDIAAGTQLYSSTSKMPTLKK